MVGAEKQHQPKPRRQAWWPTPDLPSLLGNGRQFQPERTNCGPPANMTMLGLPTMAQHFSNHVAVHWPWRCVDDIAGSTAVAASQPPPDLLVETAPREY
jgi:hypothetical protein